MHPSLVATVNGLGKSVAALVDENPDILKQVLYPNCPNGKQDLPIHRAAAFGNTNIIGLCVSREGSNQLERVDASGNTPLLLTIGIDPKLSDPLGTVRCLLELGADIEAENRNGDTLLLLATKKGNVALVKLLLEEGAKKENALKLSTSGDMRRTLMSTQPRV